MIYLKSILAGVVAVLIVLVLVVASLAAWQLFPVVRTGSGGMGAVSIGFSVDLLPILLIVCAIFSAGFYWQFRRASAKR